MALIIETKRAASAPGADCFSDLMAHWLDVGARTGMPIDPRIWSKGPIDSTYPACQGVKAAAEQGSDAAYRYLRRLREGLMIERKKLDHAEALVGEAATASSTSSDFGSTSPRTRSRRRSPSDLDEVRNPPPEAREAGQVRRTERYERVSFPSALFVADDAVPARRLGLAAVRRLPRGSDRRRGRSAGERRRRARRGNRAIRPLRDPRARGAQRQMRARCWRPSSGHWPATGS